MNDFYALPNNQQKFGCVDRKGRVILDFRFDYLGAPSSEGTMVAEINDRRGLIGIDGEWLCRFETWESTVFSDGRLPVVEDGSFNYIDEHGDLQIRELSFDAVSDFCENLAGVQSGDKVGFIGLTGELTIPLGNYQMERFSDARLPHIVDERLGFVDKSGVIVIDPRYNISIDHHSYFKEGMCPVKKGEQSFLIDVMGDRVTAMYRGISHCTEGVAVVYKDAGFQSCCYLNVDRNVEFGGEYSKAISFSDGYAIGFKGGGGEILRKEGLVAHVPDITGASKCENGCFSAHDKNGKFGLLNYEGEWIVSPSFDAIDFEGGDMWSFNKGNEHGLINRLGDIVWSEN